LRHAIAVDDHGLAVAMRDADGHALVAVTPRTVVVFMNTDADTGRADADPHFVRIRRNGHRNADSGKHSQSNRAHGYPPELCTLQNTEPAPVVPGNLLNNRSAIEGLRRSTSPEAAPSARRCRVRPPANRRAKRVGSGR